MINIMIVDDEPYVVKGLHHYLKTHINLEVGLVATTSAIEAIEKSKHFKVDILLSDIRMPEMDGFDLQSKILEVWPFCKTIFLSGFNEFEYVQKAIRNSTVDYVLKSEGYDKIIESISKIICAGDSQSLTDQVMMNAGNDFLQKIELYKEKFLMDLLKGNVKSAHEVSKKMEAYHIPLNMDRPMYFIRGRVDRWLKNIDPNDIPIHMHAVGSLAYECFSNQCNIVCIQPDNCSFYWFIQQKRSSESSEMTQGKDDFKSFLHQTLEIIHEKTKSMLCIICSIICTDCAVDIMEIPKKQLAFERNMVCGLGQESGIHMFDSPEEQGEFDFYNSNYKFFQFINNFQIEFKDCLVNSQKDKLAVIFEGLVKFMVDMPNDVFVELYYSLSTILISHINRMDLKMQLPMNVKMDKLFLLDWFGSLELAVWNLKEISHTVCNCAIEKKTERTDDIILRLQNYISEHLSEDISLVKLGDIFYRSPNYLCKLYKQATGMNLYAYISDLRLSSAKDLIKNKKYKIQQIAMLLGFDSASYFAKFFKKGTNYSPQEYRNL